MDDDQSVSAGDLQFSLRSAKRSGDVERTTTIEDVDTRFTESTGPFSAVVIYDYPDAAERVSNTTLRFTFDRTSNPRIQTITNQKQFSVFTYIKIPTAASRDNLPSTGFTQVQDASMVSDDVGDYVGNNNSFDITSVEICIVDET